jgi:putative zinc finger protein
MTYDKHACDLMCERLAAYIENDLSAAERAEAEQHLAECAQCAEALVELRAIAAQAAQLPLLAPSRDLWSGIESRISKPLTLLPGAATPARRAPRRQWQYAIAAGLLVAVTAGTTYMITARSSARVATGPVVASTTTQNHDAMTPAAAAAAPSLSPSLSPASVPATVTNVSRKKEMNATRVYDREISLLDSLVHTRRESLDPKTVQVIEQNLKIIDRAIAESRAALAKDPRSPLLANQLDNVLGSKVELLRTIAFLPTQS